MRIKEQETRLNLHEHDDDDDMPKILENNSFSFLFTDDTSVLRRNDDNIQLNISFVFKQLNRWFTSNVL